MVTKAPLGLPYAQVAQLVEQRTENPRVAGSIPALGTLSAVRPQISLQDQENERPETAGTFRANRRVSPEALAMRHPHGASSPRNLPSPRAIPYLKEVAA